MTERFQLLNARVTGQGSRTIVLSHGFGTDQTAWDAVRPWMDAHFRVLSYDLAGCGPCGANSYDARRHHTLFGFADDLLDLLDELALDDCIYIGHSVSGMIGAAAAIGRPGLFRDMIMIGASARYLNDRDYVGGFEQRDLDSVYSGLAANFQAWCAGFAPMVVGVADQTAIDRFCHTLFLMRPDIALAACRTIFQSDMPVGLIQTRRDPAVPLAAAEWLHAHIGAAELDVIEAEGHIPHMTAPAEVIRVLEDRLTPSWS